MQKFIAVVGNDRTISEERVERLVQECLSVFSCS